MRQCSFFKLYLIAIYHHNSHRAANSKEQHLLQLLYKRGNLNAADLTQQDEYGSTPLHFAAVRNSQEAVQFILAHGGNPLLLNNNQKKASDVTSDDFIRQRLVAKENAIIDKRLQDRGRPPRRSTENLALIQPRKPTMGGRVLPTGMSMRAAPRVPAPAAASSSPKVSNDKLQVDQSTGSLDKSKTNKLKTFVSATAR